MYGATQEIPFPGKLRLRGEVAAREADRTEQECLATRLTTIARLKEAYYELHLVHKSIAILEKNKMLLKDSEKTARVRYAVGIPPSRTCSGPRPRSRACSAGLSASGSARSPLMRS